MRRIVGAVLSVIVVAGYIGFLFLGVGQGESPLTLAEQALAVAAAVSGFVLWVWMITDFFQRSGNRNRALWGWSLVIFNLLASVIYFLVVYYPRKNGEPRSE